MNLHGKKHHHSKSDIIVDADELKIFENVSKGKVKIKKPKQMTASADTEIGYVFKPRKHHNKKKMKKSKKILIIIGISLMSVILLAGLTVFILQMLGKNALLSYDDVDMTAPDVSDVTLADNGKTVTYKGHEYKFNEDITSILFLGVDKRDLGTDVYGTGGQADVDIVVANNTKTGDTTAISLSRETMADINVYSAEGKYINNTYEQLCLAYAYGDGKELSCENSVRSVSRIMYGLPINSYFALDLDAISVLNDSIGGVSLTMNIDMTSPYGREMLKGTDVTLIGKEAESYVRARDSMVLESNNDRMDRQIQYLNSFVKEAVTSIKEDASTPVRMYNAASPYMVTNLSLDKVTYLALNTVTKGAGEVTFKSVPGEIKKGEKYAEFYPDETALYELILSVFYTQIS